MTEKQIDRICYNLNALAARIWAFYNAYCFETVLLTVVNEGGDADTNACVAGSLLGVNFGYHSIPKKYIDRLIYKEILENKFSSYT
jgi:ADP-ribosylglycohydrolase